MLKNIADFRRERTVLMTYQKFIGKQAIKAKMSEYLFKKFSQWYFKRKINLINNSSIAYNSSQNGSATIHIVFAEGKNSSCVYFEPGCDYGGMRKANNLCIFIGAQEIEVRMYENGSEFVKFNTPIFDVHFDYLEAFRQLGLIGGKPNKPEIDDKHAMNKILQEKLIDPLISICDYLVIHKKLPSDFDYDPDWGVDVIKLIRFLSKKQFANQMFIKFE